jgi:hypothetical protein
MDDQIQSFLLTSRLVSLLRSIVPGFQDSFAAIQASQSPALQYPDGSLEADILPETEQLWQACIPRKKLLPVRITQVAVFRSLPPFEPAPRRRIYRLLSVEEHEKRLAPGGGLLFAPAAGRHDYPQSNDLADLHLNLQFYRRISRDAMARLVTAVRGWHDSVSGAGMFGEGSVGRLSPEIEFRGRYARFSFDAGRIGQRTINWLILSLLNASYDVLRPCAMVFNDVEHLPSYGIDPGDEPVVRLSLIGQEVPAGETSAGGRAEPSLPDGAFPHPEYRSDHFPIWQTPVHEWEAMNLTVHFDVMPDRAQKREFVTLLNAWATVATAGGFGGQGAKLVDDPVFLKGRPAALVRADFGAADPDQAMPVLIRLLENYASSTLPIEAIVLGLDINNTLIK